MLLSIVVPIYNVEKYLEECLDSLVIQDLDLFEILCINDGSTDKSFEILKKYQLKYPDIIKVYDKENGGLADTRNFGIEKATGQYIGFIDSDDWVSKDMFSKLIDGMIKNDADIGICDYEEIYENEKKYISDSAEYKLLYESLVCNKVFKKTLFTENQINFPVGLWYEDNAVTYKLLFVAKKIYKINESKYFYRRTREGSIMNSQKSKKIYDMWEVSSILYDFFKEKELDNTIKEQIEYIFIRNTMFRQIPKIIKFESINIFKAQKMINENFNNLESKFPNWDKNKLLINDYNNYYNQKIGCNHIETLKNIKNNYFYIFYIILKRKVGEINEKYKF